jgi:hypothetical protein
MAKKKSPAPVSTPASTPEILSTVTPEVKKTPVRAPSPTAPAVIEEEVVLTDAEGRRFCRAADCDQVSMVDGYCRYHYLLFWKKIQNRKKILADGKLDNYIEELTARYTDKFIEILRKDLRTEKDFMSALRELDLIESNDSDGDDEEDDKTYIEEIRGVSGSEESVGSDDEY